MPTMTAPIGVLALLATATLAAAPLAAQTRVGPPPLTAPGADEWYLRAPDSVSLYIRELGRGEPVIVLHGGWGMDHGYMLPALNGLEDVAHFIVYDQRGSMRSPAPAAKISVEKHVEDLDLLRQRLGLDRVTILAHSMGTFLAQAYLEKHPDHVKGLILAGAIAPLDDSTHSALGASNRVGTRLSTRPEVDEELRKQGLLGKKQLTDREQTRSWRIRFARVNIFQVDRWREMEGGQVFYNQAAANAASRTMPSHWNFIPALDAHPCPLYVVIGAEDYVDFGAVQWKEAAKRIPKLQLRILPEAGHASWIDQPELFRRTVEEAVRASARCGA
jgi:proline-specific peptidase